MGTGPIRVRAISATPVKGLRLRGHSEAMIQREGITGDWRFYLVDGG